MRENRTHGSEGGAAKPSLPLSLRSFTEGCDFDFFTRSCAGMMLVAVPAAFRPAGERAKTGGMLFCAETVRTFGGWWKSGCDPKMRR